MDDCDRTEKERECVWRMVLDVSSQSSSDQIRTDGLDSALIMSYEAALTDELSEVTTRPPRSPGQATLVVERVEPAGRG
ncbi:unnamed protein product [Nippostrongylus brasiliensis]|uniref:Carrier domain-containing protein n=1 Tax=Nippostrongylus brasiliensis TaxID=27835 RepID=A0A0N4YYM1_NIPBR|nr:unnamed protein product [Nippostrongylus brasiliensis]